VWGAGLVICLEQGADLHMAHLMPLPLTVSCFSEIQIGFTFLVPAHPGSPGKRAVKWVCVCVVGQSTSNPAVASTVAAHDYQDLENILVTSTPNPALASTVPAHGLDLENILVASTPDPALASTVAAYDNLDLDNILVASWSRQHQFLLWLQL